MSPSVRRSVFHTFLNVREIILPCSYRNTCLILTWQTVPGRTPWARAGVDRPPGSSGCALDPASGRSCFQLGTQCSINSCLTTLVGIMSRFGVVGTPKALKTPESQNDPSCPSVRICWSIRWSVITIWREINQPCSYRGTCFSNCLT